jgi:hypothetical protein
LPPRRTCPEHEAGFATVQVICLLTLRDEIGREEKHVPVALRILPGAIDQSPNTRQGKIGRHGRVYFTLSAALLGQGASEQVIHVTVTDCGRR